MILRFEKEGSVEKQNIESHVQKMFKSKIGILVQTEALEKGGLPRSEKKTVRIIDNRMD